MNPDISLSPSADSLPDGLEDLPADATFRFACHPGVPCFNRCCHDLALPLTPYDVMALCRHLGMDGENFLERYATVRTFPETGFPLPFLNMDDVENLPCPFVGPEGCRVYPARPAACRSYPLGRGTRLGREGVVERHFLVREPHCRGFGNGEEWTPLRWQEAQGLPPCNAFNDRYMRLMSMVRATGKPLEPRLATLALLCLYQLDAFRALIEEKRIFTHVHISAKRAEDVLFDDEATLDFGLDWLELVIFGRCPHLSPRGAV